MILSALHVQLYARAHVVPRMLNSWYQNLRTAELALIARPNTCSNELLAPTPAYTCIHTSIQLAVGDMI